MLYIKHKFEQIDLKIKPSLNLYMNISILDKLKIANANSIINRFSNSNPNLRKCWTNIQLQGDRYQNLIISATRRRRDIKTPLCLSALVRKSLI